MTLLLLAALVLALLLVIRSNPNTANPLPLAAPTAGLATVDPAAGEAVAAASSPVATSRPPAETPSPIATAVISTTTPTPTLSLDDALNGALNEALTNARDEGELTGGESTNSATVQETASTGPQIFSNPNAATDVAIVDGTLWVATAGGVLARDLASERTTKFTTLDGLRSYVVDSVVNCPVEGLGVVFGSGAGLEIFGSDDRWRTLSPANSGMTASDVAALECVPAANALVVGYAESGIDIFDAASGTWSHLDRNNGLASDNVTALEVAANFSALWVATGAGLTVLGNGPTDARVSVLTGQNSPLQSNAVGALEITRDGSVWIGGEGILYRFALPAQDDDDGTWTVYASSAATIRSPLANPPVQPTGSFPSGLLRAIAPGGDDTLWLGSTPLDPATGAVELCRFDPATARCLDYANLGEQDDVSPAAAQSLTGLAVRGGEVFYSSATGGVTHFDGEAWSTLSLAHNALVDNTIRDVAQTTDGTIYVATAGGVQPIVEGAVGNVLPGSREVAVVHADGAGGLWLGGSGVRHVPDPTVPNAAQTLRVADGLVADRVQALVTDADGRAWIGTDAGLSIWNGESFFNLDATLGLPNENITALLTDETGVWIGSAGGLFRFEDNRLQIYDLARAGLPSVAVTALAVDPADGALLVGTGSGAARLLGDDVEPLPVAVGDRVTSLASGEEGPVVLGTASGAWRFGANGWSRLRPVDGLPSTNVSAALVAADGVVWIGGAEGGLARLGE